MLKKITKFVLYFFGALAVLLAILLLPAHLQIRQIQPILPSAEQIASKFNDTETPVSIRYIATAEQPLPDDGILGHMVVVIEWADGKTFLIDSGMDKAAAAAFGEPFEQFFGAGKSVNYGAVEELMGDEVQKVKGVGFTHLHIDHTQGITGLCEIIEGKAAIFQTSDQFAEQNIHTSEGQELVQQSQCEKSVLAAQAVKPVPGFPGLYAIAAGGHTPGSTVWVTKIQNQIWLFAGDISVTQDLLHKGEGNGFIYSYLIVPEDTQRLVDLRAWLSDMDARDDMSVLVAHDLKSYRASTLKAY